MNGQIAMAALSKVRAPDGEPRAMRLAAIHYAAEGTNLFEFRPLNGGFLAPFSAGSHVDVHLANGLVRQYSLCNPQDERHRYVIGVKRDANGRGGSRMLHDEVRAGDIIEIGAPRNNFTLVESAAHSIFIAGGIGITPVVSMIARLRTLRKSWELHYSVRRRAEAAFLNELEGDALHLHVDEESKELLDISAALALAPPGTHFYCCGPTGMLNAFEAATQHMAPAMVHLERFSAAHPAPSLGGYAVELAQSKRLIQVAPGQTILDALRANGVAVRASCEQGVCGSCETRVLGGTPDHCDSLLSKEEKAANDVMMICCSGSKGELLVLDL